MLLTTAVAQSQTALKNLDGHWYSPEWRYGYVLRNGVGTATSTNSPNFQVGQNIIQLTATSATTFTGRQVYMDGRFYNVNVTLLPDGRLYFSGEKNVQWIMQRVGGTQNNNVTPSLNPQQEAERRQRIQVERERQNAAQTLAKICPALEQRMRKIKKSCEMAGNPSYCINARMQSEPYPSILSGMDATDLYSTHFLCASQGFDVR